MSAWLHWLQNFGFIWPWMLAFLPLPWLIRPFLKPAQQAQIPLIAPHIIERVGNLTDREYGLQKPTWQKPYAWGFVLLWLLLILAAMRPVWFISPTPFESSGRDMMLSVDLSGSMEKPDMTVNGRKVDRLTAIKSVVDDFIVQRQGDRLGLIVFGSQAFIVSPLSYDLNTIQTLLNETAIGMAGNNTALGDSIGLAIKHFKQNHNQKAVLILLTDGSNNSGQVEPLDAAQKAKDMGLVIHTIAFGNVKPELMLNQNQSIRGEIDLDTLQKIADLTGGQAFIANQTDQLQQIYQQINELETNEFMLNQYRARSELYIWPLGLALVISFFWAWRRLGREESK